MGNLSGLVLTTRKAAQEQYILTIFGSVSQITLMLIFVHFYGIFGIIWSILISKYSSAILSYLLARRLAKKTTEI
jgi:Na+-driven multidrug efflux pump